jgi:hypothetical protein
MRGASGDRVRYFTAGCWAAAHHHPSQRVCKVALRFLGRARPLGGQAAKAKWRRGPTGRGGGAWGWVCVKKTWEEELPCVKTWREFTAKEEVRRDRIKIGSGDPGSACTRTPP